MHMTITRLPTFYLGGWENKSTGKFRLSGDIIEIAVPIDSMTVTVHDRRCHRLDIHSVHIGRTGIDTA